MSTFKNYLNTYVFETELPGSGKTIAFRPITTGQIKKLLLYETSNDSDSIEDALDELINECVVKPEGFDISKLYLQDRFFLLVEMRKATRGNLFNFQTQCSSCGSQTQQVLKLSDLPIKKLSISTPAVNIPDPVELPKVQKKGKLVEKKPNVVKKEKIINISDWNILELNENISVKLMLITRKIQKEAKDIFDKRHVGKEISDVEKAIKLATLLYALSIESIITPDGEETDIPLEDREFLLNNISQTENDKILKWFDDNDFGIDFSFEAVCSQCNVTEKREIPLENFFY